MSVSLQANWHDQSLYLWARTDGGHAPPGDAAALRAAVGEVTSDALLASVAAEGSLTLDLPSPDVFTPGSEPSTTRIDDRSAVATQPATQITPVPALILAPAEAIDFLTSL